MTARLTASLRAAPATLPALVAVALFIVWATSQAGYPLTHWAPGGLIVLALLVIAVVFVGAPLAQAPTTVKVALGCLAAYTVLSFASILWAGVPGEAWEGANRTLLYLLVFALFALWPQRGPTAALLLGVWTLAMIVLAGYVLLHVNAAAHSTARLEGLLPGGRLTYPSGYANANAAQWLIAFWPALLLAREARLHWALRGVLAGGAVLLAEVALLSVSRGSLYATPVVLVLVFALLPGRARTFALLVPIAAGIAAAVPAVLRVGERIEHAQPAASAVHAATAATLLAAVAVVLVVAIGAAVESRVESRGRLGEAVRTRVRRGVGAVGVAALVVVLVGGLIAVGDPVARARHAWDTFKSPSGYGANSTSENRLIGGLGSSRYDFYRVALDEFVAHPIVGIGADNFQQQYLIHGRSDETPRYPHSVELRTLAQTGLIGALLAVVGLGAALLAGWRALRRTDDPLVGCVAAAALAGFAYWAVHGSFDWFWEFAGLGAPAFALLGLACALAPRRTASPGNEPSVEDQPSAGDQPSFGASAVGEGPSAGERSSAGGESSSVGEGPSVEGEKEAPVEDKASAEERLAILRRATLKTHKRPAVRSVGRRGARWVVIGAIVVALAAASLIAPWVSQLQIQSAAKVWARAPATAYARLSDAARWNPLSAEPYVVAGNIALRYGDLQRADHEFALALSRDPGEAYATLERGAIASAQGRRARALALLARAVRLNPRDPLTREALRVVRRGERVNISELNRAILSEAQRLA